MHKTREQITCNRPDNQLSLHLTDQPNSQIPFHLTYEQTINIVLNQPTTAKQYTHYIQLTRYQPITIEFHLKTNQPNTIASKPRIQTHLTLYRTNQPNQHREILLPLHLTNKPITIAHPTKHLGMNVLTLCAG